MVSSMDSSMYGRMNSVVDAYMGLSLGESTVNHGHGIAYGAVYGPIVRVVVHVDSRPFSITGAAMVTHGRSQPRPLAGRDRPRTCP